MIPPIAITASGWWGVLGDDFTCFNLRRLTRAVARHLRDESPGRRMRVLVGFDTRFRSDQFAVEVASVLAEEGAHPILATGFTPAPALSHAVARRGLDAAIHVTAGHHPAEYNGVKLSTRAGAVASVEARRRIAAFANELQDGSPARPLAAAKLPTLDPAPEYRRAVLKQLRRSAPARGRLKIVCDPIHGAGSGYLPPLLASRSNVSCIRAERDVQFGGGAPDCTERQLTALMREVRGRKAHLGLAVDGDGDRFGVVDRDGSFFPSSWSLALLADYLLETRGSRLGIARSVATTRLLDDIAGFHGVPLVEIPVESGEAHPLLAQGKVLLVCEENGGLSVAGHVPRKDGLLAACLVAEMRAVRRKALHQLVADLFHKTGPRHAARREHALPPDGFEEIRDRLAAPPDTLAGKKVVDLRRMDGSCFHFSDGSWLLIRLSADDSSAHCHAEARTPKDVTRLMDAGRALLQSS